MGVKKNLNNFKNHAADHGSVLALVSISAMDSPKCILHSENVPDQENVGDVGHGGDVQVWRVEVELGLDRLIRVVAQRPIGPTERKEQET